MKTKSIHCAEAVNQFPYANLWALLFFCMVSKNF